MSFDISSDPLGFWVTGLSCVSAFIESALQQLVMQLDVFLNCPSYGRRNKPYVHLRLVTSRHAEFRSTAGSPARTGYCARKPTCPGWPCSAANICLLPLRAQAS